jgi:hypothetical protein
MAAPIVPKSEARYNRNIMVGYGELPYVNIDGKPGWGLPGGGITYDEQEAKAYAELLDKVIRNTSGFHPKKLLH